MSTTGPSLRQFRVRIKTLSDWHIGTGTGRPGHIDRLVARDSSGLPYIPAKTLHGIWRDACEQLCYALDNGATNAGANSWSSWVDRIFGSQPSLGQNDPTGRHAQPDQPPLAACLSIRPARFPSPLREALQSADPRLKQVLTFIKPGVAIDSASGCALADHLRFEEMVRSGTVLEAECNLDVPSDSSLREIASALLIASAALVERLGGKRRRGAGSVSLEIDDGHGTSNGALLKRAVQYLKSNKFPPSWPEAKATASSGSVSTVATSSNDPWVIVPIKLTLCGPLSVTYRTIGNVGESLDFLPGFYLLPHVSRLFPQLRAAIPGGQVVVLPAYPELEGNRTLPIPMAWDAPKGQQVAEALRSGDIRNRLSRDPNTHTGDAEIQWKQIRDGYITTTAPVRYCKPGRTLLTHNSVWDALQRPSEQTGGVYTYEAIHPLLDGKPLVLRSELRLRRTLAEQLKEQDSSWYKKLDGIISLGRSKKDDYGEVRIETEEPCEIVPRSYAANTHQTANTQGTLLFVWIVSDTILRNERLSMAPSLDALANELSNKLGVRVVPASQGNGSFNAILRVRRLEPWNTVWGLPRPSHVAIQAGSCAVFQVQDAQGELDNQRLHELEMGGIGERTAEGFGQVCFNAPWITQSPRQWPKVSAGAENQTVGSSAHSPMSRVLISKGNSNHGAALFETARFLEKECWKQEIRRACLALASDSRKRRSILKWEIYDSGSGAPPMSQLGGLRNQIAAIRNRGDEAAAIDWIEHLESNPRRKEKWPENSLQEIKDILDNKDKIWQILASSDETLTDSSDTTSGNTTRTTNSNSPQWPTLTENAHSELKRELWPMAIRAFFDACIRAHKRDLEGQQ